VRRVILGSMAYSLSVVLITLNEAINLPRTLKSVSWAQEIVVVDSGSTDETVAMARAAGARVFQASWKGFAAQKNSAIAHATCDWILSLDADEEVTPELAREIRAILEQVPPFSAYRIRRLNHFLGKPLRHGGYWPDSKLRLFKRGWAKFAQRAVHESMESGGPEGELHNPLLHHCYPSIEEYVEHVNRYSTLSAWMLIESGRAPQNLAALFWHSVVNPIATFLYNYIFRLGFLDGPEGLLQHLNHSIYIHWKYAKAWRAREGNEL
jgi:glycosyltransferase involved in cell wall biosynthesis